MGKIRKVLRKALLGLLKTTEDRKVVRREERTVSIWKREIHFPNWIVITVITLVMFWILLLKLGFSAGNIMGLLLLMAIVMAMVVSYLRKYVESLPDSPDLTMLVGLVMIFMVVIIVFISRMPEMSAYLVPSAAASILIAMLVNVPLAAIVLAILSMFVAVVNGFDFNFFFVSLVGGFTGIYTTWNVRTRKDIMKAGFWISGANMAAILSMFLLQHEAFNKTVMNDMLCGLGNGFLSVVLTIGILPYLEEIFSIATDIKLLELADFNQPLLRKLMIEAPGTYHHSLLVGTLAEKAAETVGADALLTRVGAYYHDIGKLTKPEYFSENQSELPSKHEDLTPNMSSLILISHVKDGVALAKSHRLSKSIVDIIQQHHGTSLILYFYLKALEEYKSSALEEMKYRYMGPKPRTREAGIIMISDAVEAACRTLEEPSYDRIKDTVNKVINNKFSDGQLDECNITLLNLHRIAESFARTMTGIYHTRVEYAESTDKKSTEENQV